MKEKKTLQRIIIFWSIGLFSLIILIILMFATNTFTNYYKNIIMTLAYLLLGSMLGILMSRLLSVKGIKDNKESDIPPQKETDATPEPDETTGVTTQEIKSNEGQEYKLDIQDIQTSFLKIEERLTTEIKALGKRANLNLIIGSVIALIGWGVLVWFIIEMHTNDFKGLELLNAFIPRLTMVIMIEIFSFFFLKLYRESIDRIRYYQNEITNVELKKVAIQTLCLENESSGNKESVIDKLLSTERNAFLKRGESTIELEKMKIDSSNTSIIIKTLKDLGVNIGSRPQ